MKIVYHKDYDALSTAAAELIVEEIKNKPNLLLCAASGASPLGTYRKVAHWFSSSQSTRNKLRVIKLDEWGGIPLTDPQSCDTFLQKEIVGPLSIQSEDYISFDSDSNDREDECNRIDRWLKENGPIDCCVLGLGLNGHIAFNEPGKFLNPFSHIAELSDISLKHPMAYKMKTKS